MLKLFNLDHKMDFFYFISNGKDLAYSINAR